MDLLDNLIGITHNTTGRRAVPPDQAVGVRGDADVVALEAIGEVQLNELRADVGAGVLQFHSDPRRGEDAPGGADEEATHFCDACLADVGVVVFSMPINPVDGGCTDPENLLSLCPSQHSEHHKGVFMISGTPVTPEGLVFTTARGYVIGPVKPWPPPRPPDPTPANPDILRGDWCDNQWLTIRHNVKPPPPPGLIQGDRSAKDPPTTDAA